MQLSSFPHVRSGMHGCSPSSSTSAPASPPRSVLQLLAIAPYLRGPWRVPCFQGCHVLTMQFAMSSKYDSTRRCFYKISGNCHVRNRAININCNVFKLLEIAMFLGVFTMLLSQKLLPCMAKTITRWKPHGNCFRWGMARNLGEAQRIFCDYNLIL